MIHYTSLVRRSTKIAILQRI